MLSNFMRFARSRTEEPSPSEGLGVHCLLFREEEEAIKAMGMRRRKGDWKNGKGRTGIADCLKRDKRDLRMKDSRKQRDNVKRPQ